MCVDSFLIGSKNAVRIKPFMVLDYIGEKQNIDIL